MDRTWFGNKAGLAAVDEHCMPMPQAARLVVSLAGCGLALACSACKTRSDNEGKIVGKWKSVPSPTMYVEFGEDGTFRSSVPTQNVEMVGKYELKSGDKVVIRDNKSIKGNSTISEAGVVINGDILIWTARTGVHVRDGNRILFERVTKPKATAATPSGR